MKISRMEKDRQYIIIGFTDVDAEIREALAKNEALNDALHSAQAANRSKTTFLSGMSHEIRTPINAIIGLDTLALKNGSLDDETKDYLEKIGDSAQHLLSIINDILYMSRIESGREVLNNDKFSLGNMPQMDNIKVDHAENGKIAVELFENSTEGIYSAILMDVRMPVMDGLEAARTIRSMDREDAKRIPIIALTANAFDEDVRLSVLSGMNAHPIKPVEPGHLIRILGELIYEAAYGGN